MSASSSDTRVIEFLRSFRLGLLSLLAAFAIDGFGADDKPNGVTDSNDSQKKSEPLKAANQSFRFLIDFRFLIENGEMQLFLNQQRVATYLLKHDQVSRRALVNVRTPSGIPVTRNFPPQDLDPGYKGEVGIIHPVMHPGLWMSFGWIDGNDYWRLKSKVEHEGFFEVPMAKRGEAGFKSRDRYVGQDGSHLPGALQGEQGSARKRSDRFSPLPKIARNGWL
jgi:hypothetical protein